MHWLRRLWSGRRLDADLDAELRFHVDEETDRLVAEGLARPEARRRALASFGGLAPMREHTLDARGTRWVHDVLRDVRYAFRMMRRTPVFTTAVAGSIAIGVGANAGVFSVVDALVLRALPVDRPHELVLPFEAGGADVGFRSAYPRFSYPYLVEAAAARPDVPMAAMSPIGRMQITRDGRSELVSGQLVSGDWFAVLGVRASAGRLLSPDDDRAADPGAVVVLSYGYWERAFDRAPDAVGRTLVLNNLPVTVVGVAAESFRGMIVANTIDIWVPTALQHAIRYQGNATSEGHADTSQPWVPQADVQWLMPIARVPPGADRDLFASQLDAINRRRIEAGIPGVSAEQTARRLRERVVLVSGARGLSGVRNELSGLLTVLMATVGVVLLIACTNLASLLLARSATRDREISLRLSLGASRGRLIQQLLTETVLLAVLGGALALIVGVWCGRYLLVLAAGSPSGFPIDVGLNARLVGFTLGVSTLAGLLFGLAPARRLRHADIGRLLNDRSRAGGHSADRGALPMGRVLVAGQVALAVLLVAGALLLVRTFTNLIELPSGFDREGVVAVRFEPALAGLQPAELPALYQRMLDAVRATPGVESASLAYTGVVSGAAWSSGIVAQDRAPAAEGDSAREDIVADGYFRTTGIALLRGRDFDARDRDGAPRVAVVNEAFVTRFFPGVDPIGKRFGYSEDRLDREIVGIVADVRVDGLRAGTPPHVYYPLAQNGGQFLGNLYARTSGDAAALSQQLRDVMSRVDSRVAVRTPATLATLTERTISGDRLLAQLTGAFAGLALSVAALGLFGTVSYSVSRRTNELGMRMALGATPQAVRRLVIRDVVWLVGAGCVAGLGMALVSLRLIESLLFGLSATDPLTLGVAVAAMLVVGLLAGAIPAWRASRIDPLVAIRAE